jgi:hypothetical protein
MNSFFRKTIFFVLSVVISAGGFTHAQAANSSNAANGDTFRAGGISFVFPTPSKELIETGSDYRVMFEPLAPTNNRLVAAFVLPEVLPTIRTGGIPPLHQYALVEVPRRAEFSKVDAETFKQITDAVGKQFTGDLSGPVQEQVEESNRRLKALGSTTTVTMTEPVQLGAFFVKPDAVAYGMIMPISAKDVTVKMATAICVIRVHDRAIFGFVYSVYQNESTVAWLRSTAEQWTDAVLKANK